MKSYSLTLQSTEPTIRAQVRFPAEHVAFAGHFPGFPILPAFMQVQVAVDVLSAALGRPISLQAVEQAKFIKPIQPDQDVSVDLRLEEGRYMVTLSCGDQVISRFQLAVQ